MNESSVRRTGNPFPKIRSLRKTTDAQLAKYGPGVDATTSISSVLIGRFRKNFTNSPVSKLIQLPLLSLPLNPLATDWAPLDAEGAANNLFFATRRTISKPMEFSG